jgi:hypothetical protein
MPKSKMIHLYVAFRVDGYNNEYRNDITGTDVSIEMVRELLKIVLREIKAYFKHNNIK